MEINDETKILEEIERLKKSPYVKLAKKAEYNALRQRLNTLRYYEKKGRRIAEDTAGIEE